MSKKYIVAFEISGSQIKGALASIDTPGSTPTIEAIISEDQINCVRYGRVQNLADAAKHVSNILGRLQKNPIIAGCPITGVYVGLAGRSLTSQHTTVTLDLPTEMEITQEILRKLFTDASKKISPQKMALKVLPRRYMVDNQSIPNPVGVPGKILQGDFTVVTCNPVNRRHIDMVFNERVQIDVISAIVTPLAIADMVLDDEEKELGCVLVDMGAQTTTVSVYKYRSLQYIATLPIGSHNITRDLSIGLNITEEKAESTKCTQGDALSENKSENAPKINSFVQARAAEIIANIKAQIEFAGFRTSDMGCGCILTGRGIRLKNFNRLLENNTKLQVRTATVPADIRFKLSDPAVVPADYMSLLAIIYKICHNPNCPASVEIAQTVVQPVQPPVQQPQEKTETSGTNNQRSTATTAYIDDDDDANWADDKLEGGKPTKTRTDKKEARPIEKKTVEKKPENKPVDTVIDDEEESTPKKSRMQRIKERLQKILSTPDIDDTEL